LRALYLIDTNVVSEARKIGRANPGVQAFFERVDASKELIYLSAVSVGELRRGVELIRRRGDNEQADLLEAWLTVVLKQYEGKILAFDSDAAQVWGRLRVPDPGHPLDKQIAAIALVNDLTLVTRNEADFMGLGVKVNNPFLPVPSSE
jgi:predicted nucleic acid-binding protein